MYMFPTFSEYVLIHPRRFAVISLTIFAFTATLLVAVIVRPPQKGVVFDVPVQEETTSNVLTEEDIQKQLAELQAVGTVELTEEEITTQLEASGSSEETPLTEEDITAQLQQLSQ